MDIYTGLGYDIHKLVRNRKFILGNIEIPYSKGFLAHSDGDVLIHALIDALLGAGGFGDIGSYFPDNDPAYKGIDSSLLLQKTMTMLTNEKYQLINIDATIICQKPKIGTYKDIIKEKLSQLTGLPKERISIKGKTKECMDSAGKGKAVEVFCAVLIKRGE
ncbi:MAG: 2-C-methyl-D-erythritol 2,4-cyclodiphosphate synthase [Spirochaetes bacterium GWF1_31_7]|nr:MAG: 2-C-methyl-D-erythritol 2,4-cyclodiphosphate synthase [Spirochaetes bacterium GWE1_32_154]OHD48542.1 MAG: 2-C-methyl-D-erythritol 2,4-cyclodiphosphate synthase [Spirochaetes bacterium GWE2_31_10]OHD51460.1 MAG: 2-C-methyl-D-erythritol 2,4-cyclodiphosphate synthase [Spirochaetes bacterium GWF1_31_7]OHD78118.1 MAG: 2-C-methyl-D-erythritol 2,4-cyclodiphosphate synthase [Spirochaetes bacterium RIFOXYB1_FULL_32_8]